MDDQVELVDQPALHELPGEVGTRDLEVAVDRAADLAENWSSVRKGIRRSQRLYRQ